MDPDAGGVIEGITDDDERLYASFILLARCWKDASGALHTNGQPYCEAVYSLSAGESLGRAHSARAPSPPKSGRTKA